MSEPNNPPAKLSVCESNSDELVESMDPQQSAREKKGREQLYNTLFFELPIGIQEQDWSLIKKGVDKLQAQGIENLREYLISNPLILREFVDSIVINDVNPVGMQIYGAKTIEEYIDDEENVADWWDETWAELYASEIAALAGDEKIHYRELKEARMDGSEFDIRLITRIVKGDEDTWQRVLTIMEDVTERKKQEADLRDSEALFRQASRIAHLGHYIWDWEDENYLFVSDEYARILGIDTDQVMENFNTLSDDIELVHPEDRERVENFFHESRKPNSNYVIEYRLIKPSGGEITVRETAEAIEIKDGQVKKIIGVLQNITRQKELERRLEKINQSLERKVAERTADLRSTIKLLEKEVREKKNLSEQLRHLANHDALTGLPSLRLGRDRILQAIAESKRRKTKFALMFLDLDGFKRVNDAYGHKVGDQVLKVSADRIRDVVREVDTVARIGGDEFAVIITNVSDKEIVGSIADNLIKQVNQAIDLAGSTHRIGVSIGIAMYPDNGREMDTLISASDEAMYKAKKNQKNHYRFA